MNKKQLIVPKIVIYNLDYSYLPKIIQKLNAEETESILGGFYPYSFHIMNTTDRTYIGSVDSSIRYDGGGAGSINYHDNNIKALTTTRSIYNKFI